MPFAWWKSCRGSKARENPWGRGALQCRTLRYNRVGRIQETPQLEVTEKIGPKVERRGIGGVLFVSVDLWHLCQTVQQGLSWGFCFGKHNMRFYVACRPLCFWTIETSLRIATLLCREECFRNQTTNINIAESITCWWIMLVSTICRNSIYWKCWTQHQRFFSATSCLFLKGS